MACTRDSLITDSTCYKNFSSAERTSILIYFQSVLLAALGGTNYTIGSGGTLEAAALCLRDGLDIPFLSPNIYQLAIAYNAAVAAGGSPASNNDDLADAIACNVDFPIADKAAQLLQLNCEIYATFTD